MALTPSSLKQEIITRHKAQIKRTLMIESAPGVGKTQIVRQAAEELEVGFKVIHAPLLQPEDYGLPVVKGKDRDILEFVVSADKFPLEDSDCEDTGIFLIDELPQADNSAQKILANLLQEREIHGKKIKDGWTFIATGNKIQHRSGANKILGHLANRITRVELEASLDDWSSWALENGVPAEVVAFIRFRPNLLSNYDPNQDINATPRAWVEGVAKSMGVTNNELDIFAGDVGEGPAAEFMAFLKIYRSLPNPDAILMDPKKAKLVTDPATQFAVCAALVNRITQQNFERALTYIKRLPPEFSVLFVRDAGSKNEDVLNTRAFIDWAANEGSDIMN